MKNLTSAFEDLRNHYINIATDLERSNFRALAGSVFLGSISAAGLGIGISGDNPYYLVTGTFGMSLGICLGTLSAVELADRNIIGIGEEEEVEKDV
ncbi:hypothetical protein KA107_00105 [Candidatus Pacearchaeota archaeon]|nr:hypothetical protein [Candidatus Pacearchaeota archaeon]